MALGRRYCGPTGVVHHNLSSFTAASRNICTYLLCSKHQSDALVGTASSDDFLDPSWQGIRSTSAPCGQLAFAFENSCYFSFLAQTKMSWRSLLTSQYSRQPLGIKVHFFLTDSRSSKSTQDCAWESGRLQHMIQWIPAKRGTWQRPRVHMRIPQGSLIPSGSRFRAVQCYDDPTNDCGGGSDT